MNTYLVIFITIVTLYVFLSGNREGLRTLDMKEPTDPFKDAECKPTNEPVQYERIANELWHIKLRIGMTQQPLLEKDLIELKRLNVIDQQMTQESASKRISDFMADLKTKIVNKKKQSPNYSGNLQNSKGGLCLTAKQIWLLKTRGGNASTGEAQIG